MMQDTSEVSVEYEAERGFVYSATGDQYITMARRAARNLKRVCPDIPIDLFTDQDVQDDVFDQVHRLNVSDRRPKMESLFRSRFLKTIILDTDTIALADISEIFDCLETCDFAAVHAAVRNAARRRTADMLHIPASFPEFNSGVIGLRKNEATMRMVAAWERSYKEVGTGMDQPHLRKALFEAGLKLWVLPEEFNLLEMFRQRHWGKKTGPLRILHVRPLKDMDLGSPDRPFYLDEVLPPRISEPMFNALKADIYLTEKQRAETIEALKKPSNTP